MEKIIEHVPAKIIRDSEHEVWKKGNPHYLDFKYYIQDGVEPEKVGLVTLTKVTHGLRLTGNNLVYLPKDLQSAIPTISSPYPIPIKAKHKEIFIDDEGKGKETRDLLPIGRGYSGRWVQNNKISETMLAPYMNVIDSLTPTSSVTRKIVNELTRQRRGRGNLSEGAGWVLVKGVITDPEAIDKILDKRLLTVSVEMEPENVYDSITGKSFMQEELDWGPGDIVNDQLCIGITEGLRFTGYAFATHPADSFAKVIEQSIINPGDLQSLVDNNFQSIRILDSISIKNSFDITDSEASESQSLTIKTLENEMIITDEAKGILSSIVKDATKEVLGDINLSIENKEKIINDLETEKVTLQGSLLEKETALNELNTKIKSLTEEKEILDNLVNKLNSEMKPYLAKIKSEIPVSELLNLGLEDSLKLLLENSEANILQKINTNNPTKVEDEDNSATIEDSPESTPDSQLGKPLSVKTIEDNQVTHNDKMPSPEKTYSPYEKKAKEYQEKYDHLKTNDRTKAAEFYLHAKGLGFKLR